MKPYLLQSGDKIKFLAEKQAYTVQATSNRYSICTKPFNARKTVLYTIIDWQEQVRGTENLIFCFGAENPLPTATHRCPLKKPSVLTPGLFVSNPSVGRVLQLSALNILRKLLRIN